MTKLPLPISPSRLVHGRRAVPRGIWSGFVRRARVALILLSVAAALPTAWAQQTQLAGPLPEGISDKAAAQIASLLADKESRTPEQQKIDSQLLYATRMSRRQEVASGVAVQHVGLQRSAADANVIHVELHATVSDALLAAIKELGGTIVNAYPGYNSIEAWLHLEVLETLTSRPDVRFIQPVRPPERDTGSVNSQGDTAFGADVARMKYPLTTSGLKIGVISDSASAAGIARSVGNGDLSTGQVTVVPNQDGGAGTDEGLAMLEIINDVCPGAKLFFATSGTTESTFAANIQTLRNTYGCDIIVDDIRLPTELPFQDSMVARAVNAVTADGALYFCAAGNGGSKSKGNSCVWVGDFKDGGLITLPASGPINPPSGPTTTYRVHSFQTAPSVQNYNVLTPSPDTQNLSLFWADPENASSNDYDLFQLDSTGTNVIGSSTNVQNGSISAYESFYMVNSANSRVVVVKKVGAQDRALYVSAYHGALSISTNGFARGHSNAANAVPVAAAPAWVAQVAGGPAGPWPNTYTSAQLTETFSSDGPIRKFFNADGTAVTQGNFLIGTGGGSTRQYPAYTAPDGVSTTVPGFQPFYGTSAAAPHAAAVAGLLKAYKPNLTNDQIRTAMANTTLDILSMGTDYDSGSGILRPYEALKSVTLPPVIAVVAPGNQGSVSAITTIAGTVSEPNGLAFQTNPSGVAVIGFTLYHTPTGDYWNGSAWTQTQVVLQAPIGNNGTWRYTGGLPTGTNARTGQFGISAFAVNIVGVVSQPQSGVNNILFTVDQTPPTVTITSPAPNAVITQSGYTFSGTANDDVVASYVLVYIRRESDGYYWNGSSWVADISSLETSLNNTSHTWAATQFLPTVGSGLTSGSYTFIAQAFDQAGNSSAVSVPVTAQMVFRWIGGAQSNPNDWGTATNWMPNGIPADNDVIQLDNGGRIDSNQNRTVRGLRLLNGSYNNFSITLTGPAGTSVWSGGAVENFLIVSPGAGLTVDTAAQPYLHNATLVNAGTITLTSSNPTDPGYLNGANATLANLSGGTVTVLRDGLVLRSLGGTNLVTNQLNATFVKTLPATGRASLDWAFDNNGTVVADAGTLALVGGSSDTGGAGVFMSGAAGAGADRRLEFGGGVHHLKAGARFAGAGRGLITGATVILDGAVSVGQSGQPAGGFEQTGGQLTGAGSLSVLGGGGTCVWSSGELNTTYNLGAGASLAINTSGTPYLHNATLNNSGTVSISASDPNNANYFNGANATLNNLGGGTITVLRDGLVLRDLGGTNLVSNQLNATFVKTLPATGRSIIGWAFDNNGTVVADAGTLALVAGSSSMGSAGVFMSGAAGAGADRRLEFGGGGHALKAGARFAGAGRGLITSGTVSVDGAVSVGQTGQPAGGFEQAGGQLTGAGSLSVLGGGGTCVWSSGELNTTYNLGAGTSLAIDTSGTPYLHNATLNNSGTVSISASDPNNVNYLNGANATLNNLGGGTITVLRDGLVLRNLGGTNLVTNQLNATFVKTLPATGRASLDWAFDNSGTVVADAGTLALNAGSSDAGSAGVFMSGAAGAGANRRLEFSGGTHHLKAGARFAGAGRGLITGATVSVDGAVSVGQSGQPAGGFEQTGGQLTGGGSLSVLGGGGTCVWSSGEVNTTYTLGSGATLAIDTSGTPYLHNATLNNSGSITITASDPNNPLYFNGANATLNNLGGATIAVLRDGLVLRNLGGTNLVTNQLNAIFSKTTASTGTSAFEWPLDNNGTVQADAGTMAWNAGSSSVGSTGTWKASVAAARVQFSGGTHLLKGGTIFTGLGRIRVAGGTVSVSDLVTLGASGSATGGFELTGGTIQGGPGSILNHLSGGTFAWSGGTLSVATVNISNGTVMAIDTSGSPYLSGCTLNSSALITLTASDPNSPLYLNGNSSLLKNFAGGRIELGRDGLMFRNIGSQPILVNQGTIVKTAGTGTTDFGDWMLQNAANASFGANTGTLAVGTPATFDQGTNLTGPGRVRIQTDVTIAGQVNVATETRFAGGTLTGSSFVKIGAGTLYWDSGTFTGTVTIAAGSTLAINTSSAPSLNNATLTNAGTVVMSASDLNNRLYLNGNNSTFNNQAGAVFQIANSSFLRNVGTPPTFANAGTVRLPTAATLSTDWPFSQSATGVLDLALTSATAFSSFSSSTSVALGGQLKVSRDPNYVPATSASFPVMSFASRSGAFASTVGLGLHNGYKLSPTLAATSVTLGVIRSSFGNWQDQKFGASANDPNIAGPYATPAGDGIPNVLKYAFGIDPFANGTSKLPKAGIVRDAANGNTPYLGISFRRLIGASDPIYVPRVSSALTGAWDDSGANVTLFGSPAATGDGVTELVTFRLMTPVTPGAQAFMDVLVDFE